MHGTEMMLPNDIMFVGVKEWFKSATSFVDNQRSQLEKAYESVRKNTNLKQRRQIYYYDRNVRTVAENQLQFS